MTAQLRPRLSEGEAGRALAIGELNLVGTLVAMNREASGDVSHIFREVQNAYAQLGPQGKQVLREFAVQMNRVVLNG